MRVYDWGMNVTQETTVDDLLRGKPGHGTAVQAEAAAPSSLSSWPDLLHLVADILKDAMPLLEKGGKANVLQLLMLYTKVQAAWQAYKALRSPVPQS